MDGRCLTRRFPPRVGSRNGEVGMANLRCLLFGHQESARALFQQPGVLSSLWA